MSNPQYAPNPKNQKVYRNLQNKKLSDVTAKDIQQLTDPTFIQATNQDALITYNMLNQAAMRNGLPIPASMKNGRVEATSSGTQYTILSPLKGEVWQVVGAFSTSGSGISGTVYLEVKLRDLVNASTAEIISTSTSSGTDVPMTETTQNPLYIDENMALQVEATGTFTSIFFVVPLIRVR
tara:strand:+ start:171 stop:710 length:540 start_codon:yes stop_codon:yes gene_type:complete